MIKHLKISYLSILLTLLAATLGGCVYDDSPAGCGDGGRLQGDVPVRLTLRLDGFGEESRASGVWNNEHYPEIGTRYDSQINRLHVMLIDGSGNLAHTTLRNYMYDADDKGYTFVGNINFPEEGWEAGNYRVMVLANCGPAQLGAKTLTELKAEIDDVMWYNPDGSPRSGILIPMWGATTHTFTFTGNNDAPEDIGSIDLLRAVSKVQIMLDPSKMGGYELVSVKISTANAYINPFPTGWEAATATIDKSLRFGSAFNPVSSAVTGGTFVPDAFPDEARGSIVFYLPEYDSATTEATIDVTLRHEATGQTFTYPAAIHFNDGNINKTGSDFPSDPDYPGKRLPTDIVRNHYYQFIIDGIEFGTISYSVNCWNYIYSELGWNVGQLDYTFNSNDNEAVYGYLTYPCYDDGKKKEYYYLNNGKIAKETFKNYMLSDKSTDAGYEFTLTSPPGAVWKAFLVNADGTPYTGDHFEFAPGNTDDINRRSVSTGITRPEPYYINVRIKKGLEDSNKVGANVWGPSAESTYTTPLKYDDYPNLNLGSSIKKKDDDGNWWHYIETRVKGSDDTTPADPYFMQVKKYAMNEYGRKAKEEKLVPEVYLCIKISLDGGNIYSEPLNINPLKADITDEAELKKCAFKTYKFAGDATKLQIRRLFIPYSGIPSAELIKGEKSQLPKEDVWWGLPMGHIEEVATPQP